MDQEIVPTGNAESPYEIRLASDRVKNRRALVYPLPANVCRWLDEYLATYRPRLGGSDSKLLFPGKNGAKDPRTLLEQVSEQVFEATGMRVTLHQFRHIAAALFLQTEPANFADVKDFLGHRNLATTLKFYAPTSSMLAQQRFQRSVLGDPIAVAAHK